MPLQRGASQVSAVLFGATLRILLICQDKEDNVGIWIGFAELPTCSLFSPLEGWNTMEGFALSNPRRFIIRHVTLTLVSFLPAYVCCVVPPDQDLPSPSGRRDRSSQLLVSLDASLLRDPQPL